MTLTVHNEIEQGTDEWMDVRRGMVTASAVGQLITAATRKPANNDASRGLTHTLVAERITGFTEPTYATRDMERGTFDEPEARATYNEHIAPVVECGFMVRDDWGYQIGYSPDGLVGGDGLIEIKSRRQKVQLATILTNEVPPENMAQCQAGLLVSGRDWCDYVSYCGGMPLYTKRVYPDPEWHTAILEAVATFEERARLITDDYRKKTKGLPETKRIPLFEEMRL